METNKPLTVLEALKHIRTDLGKIPVKVDDIGTIGNPISVAIMNIGAVIETLEKMEEAQHAEDAGDQKQDV